MPVINLRYDKTELDVSLPESAPVQTLIPRPMEAIGNPHEIFTHRLESPLSGQSLKELADGISGDVLILVPDHTRVSGIERSLEWLLDALNDWGIPDDRIKILMALGSHKKPTDEKLRGTIGKAMDRVEVIRHDTSGPMVDCGTTSYGTRVLINARLKEAELVILCTVVGHHYFAGYGGGRKIIVPGISALETISSNHSLVFWGMEGKRGRNPFVRSGILDGNPVHEDMLEAAVLALGDQLHFSIVTVMTPDKEFGLFSTGELDESHRNACEFLDRHAVVDIAASGGQADLIIASAGGYPKDLNLIQSHKGMDNAVQALKPGGTLLYFMSCSDGTGHAAIEEFAPLDAEAIRARLAEDYIVYGQTVYAMKEKAEKFRIVLVTELDHSLVRTLGFVPASGNDDGIRLIEDEISQAEVIYYIPRADLTIPRE